MPKITELPPVGGVNAVDTLPLVQAGTTAKATFAQLPISTAVQTALDAKVNTSAVGTIASQNANSVAITGGTISGVPANFTSGSITGITDLAVADGGTGASTASQARTNLGATTVGSAVFTAANAGAARTAVDADAPAFSAVPSAATSLVSLTATKVTFGTEEYDTNNCYDPATSRFTPNKAGIYRLGASVRLSSTATLILYIYKNGTQYKEIGAVAQAANHQNSGWVDVQANGTTDYFEVYVNQSAATQNNSTAAVSTWFQGSMIRAL